VSFKMLQLNQNKNKIKVEIDRTQQSSNLKATMRDALTALDKGEITAMEAKLLCDNLVKSVNSFMNYGSNRLSLVTQIE